MPSSGYARRWAILLRTPALSRQCPGMGIASWRFPRALPRQFQSIAVQPLENLSRDAEQEYFADGLTESLITNLAKISALRVVSRTTAMNYKGVRRSLTEIAHQLNVDAIVEGTVLRSGEQVRISVQLIDASTDAHLWAESYDRDLRDILALQSEIARAIAAEVRTKLTQQDQEQLARARPVNPEAYEDYLKGRYYWNKRTPSGVKKGGVLPTSYRERCDLCGCLRWIGRLRWTGWVLGLCLSRRGL
jgi:TolB-like protein